MLDTNTKNVVALMVSTMRYNLLLFDEQIFALVEWRPAEGLVSFNVAICRDITTIIQQQTHTVGFDARAQQAIAQQIDNLTKISIQFHKDMPWVIFSQAN